MKRLIATALITTFLIQEAQSSDFEGCSIDVSVNTQTRGKTPVGEALDDVYCTSASTALNLASMDGYHTRDENAKKLNKKGISNCKILPITSVRSVGYTNLRINNQNAFLQVYKGRSNECLYAVTYY